MKLLTQALKDEIAPFFYSEHNGTFSALLGADTYKEELWREYAARGAQGSGYGWDAVADLYIREHLPACRETLLHDSEADMFCLYSRDERAVYEFLTGIKACCEDDSRFRDLLERADFASWG